MDHPRWIAPIADHRSKLCGDAKLALRRRQHHHARVRGDPSAIESGCDLLALHGWKGERQQRIVGHGGCGWNDHAARMASTTNPYARSNPYATSANLK